MRKSPSSTAQLELNIACLLLLNDNILGGSSSPVGKLLSA
jgi:hypothetical protein